MKEQYPLAWPEGWIRTRIQDRKEQKQWKKPLKVYQDMLAKELERMDVVAMLVSSNMPVNLRGGLIGGLEPRDPGVAVYFSRRRKEDYSWQDILDIHSPAPTLDEIDAAYRNKARIYHPDTGGDIAMFQALTAARDHAKEWVNQRENQEHQYVIACDTFKEVRLNLAAIRLTIAAIRQIERCGTSSLLERAFQGFAAIAEHAEK